jgi:uncharacterized protein involved in outer membrane biogenesis
MAFTRTAKIWTIILGIPAFLLLAGIIFAKVYFAGDRLKAMVIPQIVNATHREVGLKDISLSVFPTLSVSMESLTIANPTTGTFESAHFISLGELDVNVKILPLLGGSVEISEIILNNPHIALEVTKDGMKNYKLGKGGEAASTPKASTESSSGELLIGNFQIHNGTIESINKKFDTRMLIEGFEQTTSAEMNQGENALRIHGTTSIAKFSYGTLGAWYISDQPVTATEELSYSAGKDVLTFDATEIKIRDLPLKVTGTIADIMQETLQMDLAVTAPNVTMQQLLSLIPPEKLKAAEGMTSTGDVSFSLTMKGPSSETMNPETKGTFTVSNGTVQYSGLPKAITGIQVNGMFEQPPAPIDNKDIGTFSIDRFSAKLGTNTIDGTLKVNNFNNPTLATTLNCAMNLDEVKEFYPLEQGTELHGLMKARVTINGKPKVQESIKADGNVEFKNVTMKTATSPKPLQNLNGNITFNNQVVESKQLAMNIGESDMNLSFSVKNYLGMVMKDSAKGSGKPAATLTLKSKQLRMADLMSEESAAVPVSGRGKNTSPAAAGILPGMKVNADVSIDKLVTEKFTFTNARGTAALSDGVVNLNQFSVNAFDGAINTKGMIDLRDPKKMPFDFNLDIKNVESSSLLPNFTSFGKYLFGKFSTSTKLKGDLNDTLGLEPQSLLGNGTVLISEGKLLGLPIMEKLSNLINVSELKSVNFKDWTNAFTIENGRLSVKDLKVNAGETGLFVSGSQGLDGSLDYSLNVKLPESFSNRIKLPGVGDQLLEYFKDKDGKISLSFGVGGAMENPALKIDTKSQEEMAKQALEQKKQKAIDDAKKKLDDELKKKLGDGLKNILKKP